MDIETSAFTPLHPNLPDDQGFTAKPQKEEVYLETDIFAWANNIVQYVDELKCTLYFFNKNMTPYRAKLPSGISRQLRLLCIDEILEYVLGGIDKGLLVRGFEEAAKEEHVLQRTKISNVNPLVTLLNWLTHEQHNIEAFKESEHDLKRMKGVIVSCFHADLPGPFHVIKNLPSSQIMKGVSAWFIRDDVIQPFDTMTALKVPAENQLLAVHHDLFVFSESKLKSLFGYDAKAASIAEQKVKDIETHFRLSFADNTTLQQLVKDNPAMIRKLQQIDPAAVTQADVIRHAEELEVPLMVDDSGAIIIVDSKDLSVFVNLMNDDYMESTLTGKKYEIVRKKPLKPPKEDAAKTILPI